MTRMGFERVAFDLYGTLLDVGGLADQLRPFIGDSAADVLARWRKAQLERTWDLNRRGEYEPFDVCTAAALAQVEPQVAAETPGH